MTSKIEWLKDPITGEPGYTINPVKGLCPMACSYCYARRMYKRFKWNQDIRFNADELLRTRISDHKGYRIFWGSTMELFGDWVNPEWLQSIFDYIRTENDLNTHIFLTKQPENLHHWKFPDNVWLGVSVTTKEQLRPAIWGLSDIHCNKRFLSFEPLLENVLDQVLPAEWDDAIDWAIIGQQTPVSVRTTPKLRWIARIEASCKIANIPLFQKNNLKSLLGNTLRQESPR